MRYLVAFFAALALFGCSHGCPDYSQERASFCNLYDWNDDMRVDEAHDFMARDVLVEARGATAFNGWRIALTKCRQYSIEVVE